MADTFVTTVAVEAMNLDDDDEQEVAAHSEATVSSPSVATPTAYERCIQASPLVRSSRHRHRTFGTTTTTTTTTTPSSSALASTTTSNKQQQLQQAQSDATTAAGGGKDSYYDADASSLSKGRQPDSLLALAEMDPFFATATAAAAATTTTTTSLWDNDCDDDDDDVFSLDEEELLESQNAFLTASTEQQQQAEKGKDDNVDDKHMSLENEENVKSSSAPEAVEPNGSFKEKLVSEEDRTAIATYSAVDPLVDDAEERSERDSSKHDGAGDDATGFDDDDDVDMKDNNSSPFIAPNEETNERVSSEPQDPLDNDNISKQVATSIAKSQQKGAPSNDSNNSRSLPDVDQVLASTEMLFAQVTDKATVTVKDIISSLNAEFGCTKLPKPIKAAVRERLVELITADAESTSEQQQQQQQQEVESVGQADDETEDEDDIESSESEGEGDHQDKDEDYASDGSDESIRNKMMKKKKKKKATKSKSKQGASSKTRSTPRRRKSRAAAAKLKAAALRIHAEQLRKRRVQELRVRNEELQMHQSQQDQKRAELIAAKFDTNTAELRSKRLEQRIDLWRRLDEKRMAIIHAPEIAVEKKEKQDKTKGKGEEEMIYEQPDSTEKPELKAGSLELEGSEQNVFNDDDDDDDDDDMELEIVGEPKLLSNMVLSTAPPQPPKPDILSILDLDVKAKKSRNITASPGTRSLSARGALRNLLRAKQRQMGNRWLAQELGYKTEEEHLQDCREMEKKKLQLTLSREQERLREKERKVQRMLEMDGEVDEMEDGDDQEAENASTEEELDSNEAAVPEDEDDEELALAKAEQVANERLESPDESSTPLEKENNANATLDTLDSDMKTTDDPSPTDDIEMEDRSNEGESDDLETQLQVLETQPSLESIMKPKLQNAVSSDMQSSNDDSDKKLQSDSNEATLGPTSNTESTIEETLSMQGAAANDEPLSDTNAQAADDEAAEKAESSPTQFISSQKPKGPRNAAYKAILAKEQEEMKKQKKRKSGFVEDEADEEEEEEVAGLEDFGFTVNKKNKKEEEEDVDAIDEDDLQNVVDELSDDEGDEEAGEEARKEMQRKEEKLQHKEIMRRMREGYDGRRGGGIAGGAAGARGMHRFDELVSADNREHARRLGLLNDDEEDSEGEEIGEKAETDDEDDEAALLDKVLKDRFLHRSAAELEENFSDDEEDEENDETGSTGGRDDEEKLLERQQERLAKRFEKRARMQRLIDKHGHDEEFSQSRLIDEDESMKVDLLKMKASRCQREWE